MKRRAALLPVVIPLLFAPGCQRPASTVASSTAAEPPPCEGDGFRVDLAEAADAYPDDNREERTEQLRDWIWAALAGRLEQIEHMDGLLVGMSLAPVIRDDALAQALDHQIGPTRIGSARSGDVAVMVEDGNPAQMDEEVLEAIDHERFLTGSTPKRALIYRYSIDAAMGEARACRIAVRDAAWIESQDRGFRRATVRTAKQLEAFLAGGVDLLTAECKPNGLQLAGRRRLRTSRAPITVEHIAAFWPPRVHEYAKARALEEMASPQQALASLDPEDLYWRARHVGFSLDLTMRKQDAVCAADQLLEASSSESKLASLLGDWGAIPGYARRIVKSHELIEADLLWRPLEFEINPSGPGDVDGGRSVYYDVQAWSSESPFGPAAGRLIGDRAGYQCARYDGPLQGTLTGMTFFYTDLLMKLWQDDVAHAAPDGILPGFMSIPSYRLPAVHCTAESGRASPGRAWLGIRSDRYGRNTTRSTSFAPQVTSVFARNQNSRGMDVSVEVHETFARSDRWWNTHYGVLASWEPQFELLNQILKWSVVAATADQEPCSSILQDVNIGEQHRFDQWVGDNASLRWRGPVPLVHQEEKTECLPILTGRSFNACGVDGPISGGVSGSDPVTLASKPVGRRTGDSPELGRLAPEGNAARVDGDTLSASSLESAGAKLTNVRVDRSTRTFTAEVATDTNERGGAHLWGSRGAPIEQVGRRTHRRPDELTIEGIGIGRLDPSDTDVVHFTGIGSPDIKVQVKQGPTTEIRAVADRVLKGLKSGSKKTTLADVVAEMPHVERAWQLRSGEVLVRLGTRNAQERYVVLSQQGPRGPPARVDGQFGDNTNVVHVSEYSRSEAAALRATMEHRELTIRNRSAEKDRFIAQVPTLGLERAHKLFTSLPAGRRPEFRQAVLELKRKAKRSGKEPTWYDELDLRTAVADRPPASEKVSETVNIPEDASFVFSPTPPPGSAPKGPGRASEPFHSRAVGEETDVRALPEKIHVGGREYRRYPGHAWPHADIKPLRTVKRTRVYVLESCAPPDAPADEPLPEGVVRCDGRVTAERAERKAREELHRLAAQTPPSERAKLREQCSP
jgi:hypothetical protein